MLVLDDLHWGDKPTLLLLKHLVASRSVSRLLIIATYRDTDLSASDPLADVLADLRRESGVERLALSGLADFELIELLHVLTGHDVDDRGVEIAHALSRETDGNPFFMLELLRHFAESNVFVQRDDGRWTMQGEFTDLGIPQSIREVVGRRVARLGEGAVRALGAAAVIGRDFDLDLLDAITNAGEEELLDVLDAALQAGIVSEVTGAAERYTFSHALIEHTLYDDLSAARRRRVHLRVAEALEALPLDRRMHRVGELAYHWAEATRALDSAKAVDYARLAGERALAQLAPDEAVRWYDQALELLKQQPDYAARTHAELLIGLGTAQRHGGDRAFRDTLLGAANVAATAGADDLLVRAALANSRGQVSSVNQLDTARVAVLRDAIRVSEPHSSERARLLVLQATEMSHAVHADEIEPLVEEGIAIARRVGNPATLSQVLHLAHGALMVPSNLAERIDRTAENLVLSEQLGDPIGRWSASFDRVLTMMQIGDVAEVDRHLGIVQALAAGIDEPGLRYFAATLAAGRALTAGRFAEVEAAANEILDIGSRSGQPDVLTLYGAFLLSLRRDQGRIAELIDMIATMVEDNPAITLARPSLAMCFSELDRLDEAREIFTADAANHFSHLLYNTAGWITGVCFYSEVCARLDAAEAAGELTTMLEPYADHIACGGQFCSGSVRYYLGLLATTRRDFDTADLHFSEALTANERIGAPVWSARSRIEWARMLLMRRRPGDDSTARELLEHAHAVGEALGAAVLERRATELLNA
ncbi:MAG: hypothetical protein JWM72_3676 [Actinomycetia bacterium]|nr:hypothetical protein [Actinomycetes bacterium]